MIVSLVLKTYHSGLSLCFINYRSYRPYNYISVSIVGIAERLLAMKNSDCKTKRKRDQFLQYILFKQWFNLFICKSLIFKWQTTIYAVHIHEKQMIFYYHGY